MKSFKLIFFSLLTTVVISCGDSGEKKSSFTIVTENKKSSFKIDEDLSINLKNPENKTLDSVVYSIGSNRLGKSENGALTVPLANQKLGKKEITATVYSSDKIETTSLELTFLAAKRPVLYTYRVLNEYPHDIEAYTQGLEFEGELLYESTGQYGKSSLRETNYKTGEVIRKVDLGREYFGEGLTIMNNKIYQLTWQEKVGFIYNLETLEKTGNFVYGKSPEGWGICNDGERLYKSDGTEKIWLLNPENLTEESYIEIYTNTSRINSVNELEWVEGKIYANVYQKNAIAIIDPANGAVEGVIDLSGLQSLVKQHSTLDVLNGIAYKGEPNRLFVTGKNWDKLFEIEIFEKQ